MYSHYLAGLLIQVMEINGFSEITTSRCSMSSYFYYNTISYGIFALITNRSLELLLILYALNQRCFYINLFIVRITYGLSDFFQPFAISFHTR